MKFLFAINGAYTPRYCMLLSNRIQEPSDNGTAIGYHSPAYEIRFLDYSDCLDLFPFVSRILQSGAWEK